MNEKDKLDKIEVINDFIPARGEIHYDDNSIKISMHKSEILKAFKITTTKRFSLCGYDGHVIEKLNLEHWDFKCNFKNNVLIINVILKGGEVVDDSLNADGIV